MGRSETPWHFTIEFDEDKCRLHGLDPDELYDRVGSVVEPYGNVRTGRGSWQARDKASEFGAQLPAVSKLSKQSWVMQNVKRWRTYEDSNEPEGEDYLQVIERVRPRLLRTG